MYLHQKFQVPKIEVFTYISCMSSEKGKSTHPQDCLYFWYVNYRHFKYLKLLVIFGVLRVGRRWLGEDSAGF